MKSPDNDHIWFDEQTAAYLAGGLTGPDRARYESHAATCETCAANFKSAGDMDGMLQGVFADARPSAGLEDRVITSLRNMPQPRLQILPGARRWALGLAAMLVLGGFGLIGSRALDGGGDRTLLAALERVRSASNLRQVGQALLHYSNESKEQAAGAEARPASDSPEDMARRLGDRTASKLGAQDDVTAALFLQTRTEDIGSEVFTAPSSNAGKDLYGSGTNGPLQRSNFSTSTKNLSYSYANPHPNSKATGGGYKLNSSIGPDFAIAADINPGAAGTGKLVASGKTSGNNHDRDGQNVTYGDGHVEFQTNPFVGVQRDAIYTEKTTTANGAALVGNPININDSVMLPADDLDGDYTYRNDAPATAVPAAPNFKPAQGQPAGTVTEVAGNSGGRVTGVANESNSEGGQGGKRAGDAPDFNLSAAASSTSGGGGGGGGTVIALAADGRVSHVGGGAIAPASQPAGAVTSRVIRNGDMVFEVDSFDAAFVTISKIVGEEGGLVASTDSEKLPNGKVKGMVVVRVPPDRLDTLVLKLRGLGELVSQRVVAQDVTKQYTDLESQLRAAKAMENRLIEMIKSGQGGIKELLAAEKELGVWREKIEKVQGEINYYNNLIGLATLSITLMEKDIKAAALVTERENVSAGIETEDVETARAEAIKAIDEAKGRIVQSDLKKHDAGQLAATIVAEIAPDQAGPVIDRLKQLGKVARLDIERRQETPGGGTGAAPSGRVERKDTRLSISLYNLANVEPRQKFNLNLACDDVEAMHRAIVEQVGKSGGRVVSSVFNRPKPDTISATIHFEVPSGAKSDAMLQDVRARGDVMRLTVNENPDTSNVTGAKVGFVVQMFSLGSVMPRQTTQQQLAAMDVPKAYADVLAAAQKANARVLVSQLTEQNAQNVAGYLDFEVKRSEEAAMDLAIAAAGDSLSRQVARSADTENTIDSKVQFKLSIVAADQLAPRETTTVGVEVSNVEKSLGDVLALSVAAGGRTVESNLSKERTGRMTARAVVDVPHAKAMELLTKIKDMGTVRMIESSRNAQVPDGKLTRARLAITLGNAESLVSADSGLWSTIKSGLATSIRGLLWSLQLIVIGLCLVGPWVVLLWMGWRIVKRRRAVVPT